MADMAAVDFRIRPGTELRDQPNRRLFISKDFNPMNLHFLADALQVLVAARC
jgi:hypothetical protein